MISRVMVFNLKKAIWFMANLDLTYKKFGWHLFLVMQLAIFLFSALKIKFQIDI